jgi:hypothetical protein
MSHKDWPPLQESEIHALASSKVFTRGRALFDEGALEDLTHQSEQLSALCQGSDEEPYALSIRLNEQGVHETRCSCPYDYDGICKHLVALLLAWAHTPEAFHEVANAPSDLPIESTLLTELRGRERDELAQVIVQLVETEPKLRPAVRRLLQNRLSDGEVAKTQRAVASLVRKIARTGYESNFSQVRRDLLFHLRSAASLESLRPSDAARLYIAVIQGLMAAGSDPFNWDDNRHLVDVSQQCVVALASLLPRASDSLRVACLKVLCQAYLFDINLGGYDFVEGAEALLEGARPEEWKLIEAQLDAFLQPRPAPQRAKFVGDEWVEEASVELSGWGRTRVIALKARRIEKFGGQQVANAFLIQHGTPEQQVNATLANGDFEWATSLATQHFAPYAGLIRSFADNLNEAGQWQRARDWAQQHEMTEWLAHHSAQRGEPDALQLNINLFRASPTAKHWFRVIELAPETSRAGLKVELWQHLDKVAAFATEFDIRLGEGQVMAALEIWPRLSRGERQSRNDQLAAAAETCDAEAAILLWSELAESLISHKSRDAYRLAAKALLRAKKLLEKEGRGSEWPPRSAALRTRYPALRALKEELDRAKL